MKSDDSTSWEFWGRLTATFLFAKIDIPELSYFSLFWIALIAIYFGHYYISVVRVSIIVNLRQTIFDVFRENVTPFCC